MTKDYIKLIEEFAAEGEINTPDKKAQKTFGDIYVLAHLAIGECTNSHKDWVEKWNKIIKELKKIGQL